jgi:hypothetical protein
MIWKLSVPDEPQAIMIYEEDGRDDEENYKPGQQATLRAIYKVPALLSVNSESRDVARKQLDYAYACNLGGIGVYMKFDRDALVFEFGNLLERFFSLYPPTLELARVMVPDDRLKHVGVGHNHEAHPNFSISSNLYRLMGRPGFIGCLRPLGIGSVSSLVVIEPFNSD